MNKPLILVGSRSNLGELLWACKKLDYEVMGILDHHWYGRADSISGVPVIGDERHLLDLDNAQAQQWLKHCAFFPANISFGKQAFNDDVNLELLRYARIRLLEKSGADVINIIDPDNSVIDRVGRDGSGIEIGKGNWISEAAVIGFNIKIGDYNCIESQAYLGHDTFIGNNVFVGPISKIFDITVGDNSSIGMFANAEHILLSKKPHYHIGEWSTVWSEAVIDRDIPANHMLTHTGRLLKKQRSLAWLDQVDQK